jgi:hypothetical protein
MVLKNVRWEKNKKHWVGLSVGKNANVLAVRWLSFKNGFKKCAVGKK